MNPRRDWLAWAALAAALAVTASAEWALARACGFGPWVAAGVPAALDIYAIRALRARRDVAAVVVAMIAVQALAHLVSARLLTVSVPLVVTVSTIAPLVLWRVHRIGHDQPAPAPALDAEQPQQDTSGVHQDTPVFPQVTTTEPEPAVTRLPELEPQEDTRVNTEVDTVDTEVDIEPEPLDAAAARAVIEEAFAEGLSIRQAAVRAHRSPSRVQAVYAELRATDDAPIPGQLAIAI